MRPSLSIQPLPCRNFCTVFDSKYWRRLPSRRASYEGSGAGAVPSENPRSRSSVVSLPRLITLTLAMALCWADHYPRRENDVRHSHLPAEVCALCCCLSLCFCSDFLDSTRGSWDRPFDDPKKPPPCVSNTLNECVGYHTHDFFGVWYS